jgi:hypothetical protein
MGNVALANGVGHCGAASAHIHISVSTIMHVLVSICIGVFPVLRRVTGYALHSDWSSQINACV